jgi:glycosyltransferase involved in cell wall biosynthesis
LLEFGNRNEYVLITDIDSDIWDFEGVEKIFVPSQNPLYWFYWSNFKLPRILNKMKVDVYHSFKHITAFMLKQKKILTIHGIHSHYFAAQYHKWHETLYWKLLFRAAIKSYDRILTVAESEKNYLVEKVGYPADKFSVTYPGVKEKFKVINDELNWVK